MHELVTRVLVGLVTVAGVISVPVSNASAEEVAITVGGSTPIDLPDGWVADFESFAVSDDGTSVLFTASHSDPDPRTRNWLHLWTPELGTQVMTYGPVRSGSVVSGNGETIVYITTGFDNTDPVMWIDYPQERQSLARPVENAALPSVSNDGSVVMINSGPPAVAELQDFENEEYVTYPNMTGTAKLSGNGDYIFYEGAPVADDEPVRGLRLNRATGITLPWASGVCDGDPDCVYLPSAQVSDDGQRVTAVAARTSVVVWRDVVSGIARKVSYDPVSSSTHRVVTNGNGTTVFIGSSLLDDDPGSFRWDPLTNVLIPVNARGMILASNDSGEIVVAAAETGFEIWELAGPAPATPGGYDWMTATSLDELTRSPDFSPQQAEVLRLYWAFFNRDPDLNGAKYWLAVNNTATSLDTIAENFTFSLEFENKYADTNNAEFLAIVYENILGRDYDQAGFDYWLDLLDTKQLSRGGVVRWVAANNEFIDSHPYPTS